MPNLQQFNFSLDEEPNIVPALTELAAIIKGLSGPNLISEMIYPGDDGLTEVTSVLPFVTSLTARQGFLASSSIRVMAQKDHLPNLTSLSTNVAYADMDAFIDMLKTRWVRGIEAQLSASGSAPGMILSAKINIVYAPNQRSVSRLSRKVREIQDRLKLEGATIDLVDG